MLWHTDWTTCPFTNKQMIAFIDDHSRFIVHAEYFEHATTENTILAFANAIAKYGVPEAILTDNGVQFTPARTEKGPFTRWCEDRGIKHILGRVHHPQTNGKIERWFGTYKLEYDERFNFLDEFVKFYNEERIHQGINYKKPKERYFAKV
jgi:putative transposase